MPVLDHVMKWKDEVLLRWLALLLNDHDTSDDNDTVDNNGKRRRINGGSAAEGDDPKSFSPVGNNASFTVTGDGDINRAGTRAGVAGSGSASGGVSDGNAAYGWEQRLGLAVHEAFCSARIAELFDIIADYPDSAVAIGELKVCERVCGCVSMSVGVSDVRVADFVYFCVQKVHSGPKRTGRRRDR